MPVRSGLDLLIPAADAPEHSESELVRVGRLGRHWGVRGGITLRLDNPQSDLEWADEIVWLRGEACPLAAYEVSRWEDKGGKQVLFFAGITAPEQVRSLTGLEMLVPRSRLAEPDDDEHYVSELIGMAVDDAVRGPLGKVVHVFQAGDADVWVVRNDAGREEMIPAVSRFVLDVDRASRRIRVDYPEPE